MRHATLPARTHVKAPAVEATPLARLGLRVELEHTPAGPIEVAASNDHRIRINAGGVLRGVCRSASFLYQRGDVDMLPAGGEDRWEQHEDASALTLTLSSALLQRAAQALDLDPAKAGLSPAHQLRDARIEHIAWALEAERAEGYPGGLLFAESLGLGLAVHLLGRYRAQAPRLPRGLSKRQLERVIAYIEAHLDRDLSLARLAGVAELSATHLKVLFRRSTGLPVHAYVVQRRVERARTLFARGGLSAGQIALEAGFAHQSHMARCMKRVLGITPSALRSAGPVTGR